MHGFFIIRLIVEQKQSIFFHVFVIFILFIIYFVLSSCDIKPSRYVPLWWAVLPPKSNDTVDWLYSLGFNDGMAYFDRQGISCTEHARPHIQDFIKNPHPYDMRGRVTMHRFLGYDVSHLTQGYLSYAMDFILYLFLLLVVKPTMLILIYCDLLVQLTFHFFSSLVVELLEITPLVILSTFMFYPNSLMACRLSGIVFLEKLLILGPSQYHKLRECWECFTCVFSVSLLLRFFAPALSPADPVKHESLSKMSMLYRVFRHAI